MIQDNVLFVEKAPESPLRFGLAARFTSSRKVTSLPPSSSAGSRRGVCSGVWSLNMASCEGFLRRRSIPPLLSFHLVLFVWTPGHQALLFAPARFSGQPSAASPEASPRLRPLCRGLKLTERFVLVYHLQIISSSFFFFFYLCGQRIPENKCLVYFSLPRPPAEEPDG